MPVHNDRHATAAGSNPKSISPGATPHSPARRGKLEHLNVDARLLPELTIARKKPLPAIGGTPPEGEKLLPRPPAGPRPERTRPVATVKPVESVEVVAPAEVTVSVVEAPAKPAKLDPIIFKMERSNKVFVKYTPVATIGRDGEPHIERHYNLAWADLDNQMVDPEDMFPPARFDEDRHAAQTRLAKEFWELDFGHNHQTLPNEHKRLISFLASGIGLTDYQLSALGNEIHSMFVEVDTTPGSWCHVNDKRMTVLATLDGAKHLLARVFGKPEYAKTITSFERELNLSKISTLSKFVENYSKDKVYFGVGYELAYYEKTALETVEHYRMRIVQSFLREPAANCPVELVQALRNTVAHMTSGSPLGREHLAKLTGLIDAAFTQKTKLKREAEHARKVELFCALDDLFNTARVRLGQVRPYDTDEKEKIEATLAELNLIISALWLHNPMQKSTKPGIVGR